MDIANKETDGELKSLKSCLNDLISILGLPAIWLGAGPRTIMSTLLEVTLRMYHLDFTYAEWHDPIDGSHTTMLRYPQREDQSINDQNLSLALNTFLKPSNVGQVLRIPSPIGTGDISIVLIKLGLLREEDWLIVGSSRNNFPTETEKLLLTVAANQATIGLQEARLFNKQKWIALQLDKKVAQRTKELESERDRLQLLLEINKTLIANHDLPGLFDELADNLRRVTGCEFIGLCLPDPKCGLRQHVVNFGNFKGNITVGMEVPLHGSASGQAFRNRELVYIDGLQGTHPDPEIYGTPEGKRFYKLLLKEGIPSGYFVPLIYDDKVIGVMQLTKYRSSPVRSQAIDFLNAVASQLAIAVANSIEHQNATSSRDQLAHEQVYLREEIDRSSMFEEIVGNSRPLRSVLSLVTKVAPTDSTVLITGETGTGKELIARAIHKRSGRSQRPFVGINCAAIPASLIGAELFGHEKGAFTGAQHRRLGRFELAQGGTLFLDEIGDLPTETQIALLRVLQEGKFERIGGKDTILTDVRLITATNRDLTAAVANGSFRSDLFYRLNVFPIELPPLRVRKTDIPILTEYFIHRYSKKLGKKISVISKQTLDLFQSYTWPGNIRELQNIVERSLITSDEDTFSVDENWLTKKALINEANYPPLAEKLATDEKIMIEAVLAETKGRVSGPYGAAQKLSMPSSTLESKIRALKINKNLFKTI